MKSLIFRIKTGVKFYHRTEHEIWLFWEYFAFFKDRRDQWKFFFNPPF